jgi:sterol desaturase/sphingolipid hydroxylase (fatty acid hydroxylase superfamily)
VGIARLPKKVRDSYAAESALGTAFGLLLWAVNIAWIARVAFPASDAARMQGAQLATHLFAYGLPLGWFLCLRVRDYEVPGVHRLRHKLQDASGGPEEVESFRHDLAEHRKDLRHTPDERG